MSRYIHAEIEYVAKNGQNVHSDICPLDCEMGNLYDEEYIKFLHNSLDEWLKNSRGTGIFYITGERDKYLKNEM
jgi:hypothetical protein